MTIGVERAIRTNLGPLKGALPRSQNASLAAQGIANWQAATMTAGTVTKVITGGNNQLKVRRVKLVVVTAGVNLGWATVDAGTTPAPTLTAGGAGGTNDGTLLMGGGGATEEFSILDNVDLYVVCSANAVVQITMWEE